MKKIYTIAIAAITAFPILGNSQVTFERIYPATVHESGKDVLQTSDGGYIIAASTETSITNDLDVMVIRTNTVGDTLWRKKYGGSLPESPNAILKASDGNYFVIGYAQRMGSGDFDHYLLKINALNGSLIFSKFYGGYGNEESKEIIPTSDGNYMIVGASNSVTSSFGNNNMQLIKIDINGNVLWTKNYGDSGFYESARSVKQCADGGYIVAGKRINPSGNSSIMLVKTNSAGDSLWSQVFSTANSQEGKTILVNSDGTYTLCVDDSSALNDSDVRIMKIDPSGTVLWDKNYGGSEKDICKMIQPTTDGGYVVSALSRSFGWIDPDYWILKLNSTGDTLWTRHFGGTDHEHCYAVKQTSDGGYIAVGHTRSNSPTRIEEILLIKLNSNGELGPVGIEDESIGDRSIVVSPNPSNGLFSIDLNGNFGPSSIIKICNTLGQVVYISKADMVDTKQQVDIGKYGAGIYYFTIQTSNVSITKKLIVN